MDKQIKTLTNATVETKEEAFSKNGKYYKFKIDGKKMSCWDADLGSQVEVGSCVNVQYTETPSSDGKVTFKNIVSIVDATLVDVEHINYVNQPELTTTGQPVYQKPTIKTSQVSSQDDLFNICAGEALNIIGRVYDTHYVKPSEIPVKFDETWIEAYGDTLIKVYEEALKVRHEKLGY